VVGARLGSGPEAEVGDDQRLVVRHDSHERVKLSAGTRDEAQAFEIRRGERRDGALGRLERDRELEHEQPYESRERVVAHEPAAVHRDVGGPGAEIPARSKRLPDSLAAETGSPKGLREPFDRAAVGDVERPFLRTCAHVVKL
jgi:hypothetical protein